MAQWTKGEGRDAPRSFAMATAADPAEGDLATTDEGTGPKESAVLEVVLNKKTDRE